MKAEATGEYILANGEPVRVEDEAFFAGIEKPPVYEVIRIIDGVPLFLEDHLQRLFASASAIGHTISLSEMAIRDVIRKTIAYNQIRNQNIKLLSTTDPESLFLAYTVASYYPPDNDYVHGVRTILYPYERSNPNVKLLRASFKEEVAQIVKEQGAFEALLVNNQGCVTEGSRSSLFFIQQEKLFTAPEKYVLQGITRKHLLEIAPQLGLEVVEQCVHEDDLDAFNGAFLAGTSINVLPIAAIEDRRLRSADDLTIQRLGDAYLHRVEKYLHTTIL